MQWSQSLSTLTPRPDALAVNIDHWTQQSRGYAIANTEWSVENTRALDVDYLIGADGHSSTVRRALAIPETTIGDSEIFAVFEFECGQTDDEARIILEDGRTSFLWPLPDGHCRWSFQLTDTDAAEPRHKSRLAVQVGSEFYPHLHREDLEQLLHNRAPWFDNTIGRINWSVVVRFERRLATALGNDRCWLAGDSAHLTAPMGMQSMNAGLREAADLSARLTAILQQNASPSILETYNADHLADWQRLMALDNSISIDEQAPDWVRRNWLRLLPCIPATGDDFAPLARQLGIHLLAPAGSAADRQPGQ